MSGKSYGCLRFFKSGYDCQSSALASWATSPCK